MKRPHKTITQIIGYIEKQLPCTSTISPNTLAPHHTWHVDTVHIHFDACYTYICIVQYTCVSFPKTCLPYFPGEPAGSDTFPWKQPDAVESREDTHTPHHITMYSTYTIITGIHMYYMYGSTCIHVYFMGV